MIDLQELTGQESGIVIYDGVEGIICNWSGITGLPYVFPAGTIVGLGEPIPNTPGEHIDDLSPLYDGVVIIYNANEDVLPVSGTVYYRDDGIIIIAPDGWN